MSDKHLMLDIETLGTGVHSAVLAIGARVFTVEDGPGKGFEVFIDQLEAQRIGTTDVDTLIWWKKQKMYDQVFSGKIHPVSAVAMFRDFCALHQPKYVWANAPTFDCTIMRHLCRQVDLQFPFTYKDERCARTLFALGRGLGMDLSPAWAEKRPHLPLDDATAQAIAAVMVLKQINTASVRSAPDSDPHPVAPPPPSPARRKTLSLSGQ